MVCLIGNVIRTCIQEQLQLWQLNLCTNVNVNVQGQTGVKQERKKRRGRLASFSIKGQAQANHAWVRAYEVIHDYIARKAVEVGRVQLLLTGRAYTAYICIDLHIFQSYSITVSLLNYSVHIHTLLVYSVHSVEL
jgi:hypothetical protein